MNKSISSLKQRKNECSLTVLCALNGFGQAAYEAISNKLRNEGYTFVGSVEERKASIARMLRLFQAMGKVIPAGFGTWQTVPGDDKHKLAGRGVIYMSLYLPRKRKEAIRHVVCYEDGAIIDTYQEHHKSWAAYCAHLKAKGYGRVIIRKVYPA
jgi:hypothetical protein